MIDEDVLFDIDLVYERHTKLMYVYREWTRDPSTKLKMPNVHISRSAFSVKVPPERLTLRIILPEEE